MAATASMPLPRDPANYDEVSMQQSMLFSDSLKDLKNLRKQLYSVAEYFELSYTNDDQNNAFRMLNTLKEYAVKALVNTVDHLGSVTYKVDDLLDENIDEVSGTELRVSCLEQRLRTCHEYIDREGLSQQLLIINTPNYHKRYILPVGETGSELTKPKHLDDGYEWRRFKKAVQATIHDAPPSIVSGGRFPSPTPRLVQQTGNFTLSKSIPNKDLERRTSLPHRFSLLRSGSLSSKTTTPKSSRPITLIQSLPTTPSLGSQPYISEPRKSASMCVRAGKESSKQFEQIPSKNKRLLKALLSRRKSKKDDMLYTYLDDY